jgi:decaprenyl-phosphate phosphoribosyltransferase
MAKFLKQETKNTSLSVTSLTFFIDILRTARPRQWLKNLSLAAALIFSGKLLDSQSFILTSMAVIIFSILTSSVYYMNDIVDYSRDKIHPHKRFRPIASGKIPRPLAALISLTGILTSFYLAFNICPFFFLVCFVYFILQVVYSFFLKHQIILDVFSIAASFILRIYAGAIVLNYHISIWFLLCVTSLALFLAVGKRRSELSLLDKEIAPAHRKTLIHYSPSLLDNYLSMFAASAWLSWALFTFLESPPVVMGPTLPISYLPLTITGTNKWLMVTIPVVVYGIMRYLNIVYQSTKAESPERVLLSDKPLMLAGGIWGFLVVWVIYGLGM